MALCRRPYNKQTPKCWIWTQWESGSESKNKVAALVSWPFPYARGKMELHPSIRTGLWLFFFLYFLTIAFVTTPYWLFSSTAFPLACPHVLCTIYNRKKSLHLQLKALPLFFSATPRSSALQDCSQLVSLDSRHCCRKHSQISQGYLLGAHLFLGADQSTETMAKNISRSMLDVAQRPSSLTQPLCYKTTLFNLEHISSSSRAVELEGQSLVCSRRLSLVSHV